MHAVCFGGESGWHMQLVCERLVMSLSIPGHGVQSWYLKRAVGVPLFLNTYINGNNRCIIFLLY